MFRKLLLSNLKEVVVTSEHVSRFADVVGDRNPVHLNPEFAAQTRFGKVIAHGMVGMGHMQSLLPPDIRIQTLNIKFKRPVYMGDILTVIVKIY